MIIKHAYIEKFRALNNIDFDLGSKITAIVGYNGTMKTTILGILSQTFTIGKDNVMFGEKTIDGYNFCSQFKEKFKLTDKDLPGEHKWSLELYDGIYKNNTFEAHSILRDKTSKEIRFWSTEGKGKGVGYPQVPVYYISLKRVTPLGEEININSVAELSDEEKEFLDKEYRNIFSSTNICNLSVETIVSAKKHTAAIYPAEYDALTISAGQDNIGKILLAILSFKRLKETFPNDYKGGILLIDEIESTLHPASQMMLIKRIYKYAKDYKIQFIFTTHSPTVIKSTFDKYNKGEAQMLYLKKVGDKVQGYNNPDVDSVISELSGEVVKKNKKVKKIDIFCEDVVARSILRQFLTNYNKYYRIMSCSIGAEEYGELLRVQLKQIVESVIVLDGDKNNTKTNNKLKSIKAQNVIFLPSTFCPEKMFYKFLFNLPDDDIFWDNSIGGFDKNKCFLKYPTLDDKSDSDMYKKWFDSVKSNFGKGYKKLIKYWMVTNKEEYESFMNNFRNAYNIIAKQINAEIIV
ncbi:MAG: ATP-binding protein [Ruminococcaceae bacterium]|nr:ATP-binding protein [Oscillospiraceae bacterium]